MGWIQPGDAPTDLASFNLQAEQDKLKRKRKLAQMIGLDGTTPMPQGIMTPGGAGNVGIYTKPSTGAMLASLLQKGLGAYNESQLNKAEDALPKLSQEAFSAQLNKLNDRVRDPLQDGVEANAELTREARRKPSDGTDVTTTDWIQAEQAEPPPGTEVRPIEDRSRNLDVLPLEPVQSVTTTKPTGKAKVAQKAVAKLLQSPESAALERMLPADNPLGASSTFGKKATAAKLLSNTMTHEGEAKPTRLDQATPPVAQQAPLPQTGLPPLPVPLASQGTPTAPRGTTMLPPEQQQPWAPVGNQDPYSRNPTKADMVSRYGALAQTGPMGAQVAAAGMGQLYGDKNGEYKLEMSRDPTTGELAIFKINTRTGEVTTHNQGGNGGKSKVTGRVDTPTGLYNTHTDGTTSPVLDGNGNHIMGAEANKRSEQVRTQQQTITNAVSSIDAAIAKGSQLMETAGNGTGFKNNWKAAVGDAAKIPNDASTFQQDEHSFKANLALQALSGLKAIGNGSSGMGGISDRESELLKADIGALDAQRMDAATYKARLENILMRLKTLRDQQLQFLPQDGGQAPQQNGQRQPGSAPTRLSLDQF